MKASNYFEIVHRGVFQDSRVSQEQKFFVDYDFSSFPSFLKESFQIRNAFISQFQYLESDDLIAINLKKEPHLYYYLVKHLLWELPTLPALILTGQKTYNRPNSHVLGLMHDFVIHAVSASISSNDSMMENVWETLNPLCYCQTKVDSFQIIDENATLDVIIPTKNVPNQHLNLLIKDIQDQLSKTDSIIVIDNNEDTKLIELEYDADKSNLEVYKFKSNNISEIRNYGILKSSGSLLAFVDSDDRILPTHLNSHRRFHQRFRNVAATGSWLQAFGLHDHVYEQWDGFSIYGIKYCLPPAGVLMWKRNSLAELGGFNITFADGFEDFDLVARAISLGKLIIVRDLVTYMYQRGHVSLSQSWTKEKEEYYQKRVLENIANFCLHKQVELLVELSSRQFPNFRDTFPNRNILSAFLSANSKNYWISKVRRYPTLRRVWHALPWKIKELILNAFVDR